MRSNMEGREATAASQPASLPSLTAFAHFILTFTSFTRQLKGPPSVDSPAGFASLAGARPGTIPLTVLRGGFATLTVARWAQPTGVSPEGGPSG